MHPIFEFTIYQHYIQIPAYFLFNIFLQGLAYIVCSIYLSYKKELLTIKQGLIIFPVIWFLGAIVGGRFFHWLIYYDTYKKYSISPFNLEPTGLIMWGAFIFAFFATIIVAKITKNDFRKLLDVSAVGSGLIIGFGKIGCFLNGCCYGRLTNLPWGVSFPEGTQAYNYYMYSGNYPVVGNIMPNVHPVQLYEAIAGFLFIPIALYLLNKKIKPGLTFVIFVLYFSLLRLFAVYFREVPLDHMWAEYINYLPLAFLIPFIVGVYFLFKYLKNKE